MKRKTKPWNRGSQKANARRMLKQIPPARLVIPTPFGPIDMDKSLLLREHVVRPTPLTEVPREYQFKRGDFIMIG